MRRYVVLALGLLGVLTACPAAAAVATGALQIGGWSGGPQFDSRTRQFERCTATLNNGSGTNVSFSIDRKFGWRLGFSNPSWSFGKGHSIGLMLAIGKRFQIRQTAHAVDVDRLELQLDDSLTVFAQLRLISQLRAVAGGMSVSFELRDSDEVMAALAQCALQQSALQQGAAQPRPAKSKTPARPPDPMQALDRSDAMRAEASGIAADLLSFAGISGARVLANNETPDDARGHSIWRTGHVTGTVSIFAGKSGLDGLAGDLVRHGAAKCPGRFFVAATPDEIERIAIVRLFTSCQAEPATTSIFHTLVARSAGGLYLLTVMIDRVEYIGATQGSAEDLDGKIRTVLPGVLARAAQHSNAAEQQDAEPRQ
jgi:hypothetical protein